MCAWCRKTQCHGCMKVLRCCGCARNILLCFPAGHRKSYLNGCSKVPIVICHQVFSILALVIFVLKFLLQGDKVLQNLFFWAVPPRFGFGHFGPAISGAIAHSSMLLCNSVSADRTVVAPSRFLAAAVCGIPLSFAAEGRESYWSGCIKVAIVICE